jgi:thiol-disulfide isomerase/thioredoxin
MIVIDGLDELDNFILDNDNKTIMLYFGAVWCGPCNKLKDRIDNDETKLEMPNLVVGYIDIDNDNNANICTNYKVKLLPTIVFIKLENFEVKIIDRVDGYDWIKIVMTYNKINIEN